MAGLISPTTLEQVRGASDIVEVIGACLPLKKAGGNFVALCPFHREKTPSFSVNPHKQIFYCFGCHKGGDVFTFIREYEGLSFIEAVRRLAERAKIPLEFDTGPGQEQARHLKDTLYQIHDQIARRWQTALANEASGQVARDYLAKRRVLPEAVQLFRLGYAPDVWDDTVNWAKSKGYDLNLVEQSGLIIRKEGADHCYDRFRGRLMFPICDEQGRVIAFSGRILTAEAKSAKYVNSPETPIFTKGKVFYGLDKSKRAILEAGHAIVCEGQLDLIACYMAGVRNIVAPQGTAFTSDHARILKRYVNEVVLCFDSDNAGQNAATRVLDSLLGADLAIRVAVVPAPHDPDSFIQERGGPAFRELIDRAAGFFDFYLQRLCDTNDLRTDAGRKTVVHQMREAVLKTGDQVLLDTCAQKTAGRLGVAADAVRAEFKKGTPHRASLPEPEEDLTGLVQETISRPPPMEFWLLKLLLSSDEHVPWIAERLELDWLTHPVVREAVGCRLAARREGTWRGAAAFLGDLDKDEVRNLVTEALVDPHPLSNVGEVLKGTPTKTGTVARLRNDFMDRQIRTITVRFGHPDMSDAERADLLRLMAELRERKRRPL
jgi:DNA primase